jgi:hypothetical protein
MQALFLSVSFCIASGKPLPGSSICRISRLCSNKIPQPHTVLTGSVVENLNVRLSSPS